MSIPAKILVVDGHRLLRDFLCSLLADQPDWDVYETENGEVALERIQEVKPDVVVLAVMMPEMNGLEAARKIRKLSPETRVKMTKLKNLLAHVAKTIADKDAEDLLLDTAKNSLGIVERCLLPHAFKATNDNTEMWFRLVEFHLEVAEGELMYAEGVVAKDGATVRMIG
jgi:CheY-like chemotaxis protein